MGSIELKNRRFSAKIVKVAVKVAYGKTPAVNTFGNWRIWAGVRRNLKYYTFDQFAKIVAIATIRRTDPLRELSEDEFTKLAQSDELQQILADTIATMDRMEMVEGHNMLEALALLGVRTSRAQLYRKIEGFSQHNTYCMADILPLFGA